MRNWLLVKGFSSSHEPFGYTLFSWWKRVEGSFMYLQRVIVCRMASQHALWWWGLIMRSWSAWCCCKTALPHLCSTRVTSLLLAFVRLLTPPIFRPQLGAHNGLLSPSPSLYHLTLIAPALHYYSLSSHIRRDTGSLVTFFSRGSFRLPFCSYPLLSSQK